MSTEMEHLTTREAAERLGLHPSMISVLIKRGVLTAIGHRTPHGSRGRPTYLFAADDVERLRHSRPWRSPCQILTDAEITQRLMDRITINADGCWMWTLTAKGKDGAIPVCNIQTAGRQFYVTVRPWLWKAHHGLYPPILQRVCEKSKRCVNPAHNPLRYDTGLVLAAVAALKHGAYGTAVAKQYGLPLSLIQRLLTPDERMSVRHARSDQSFWQWVDQTTVHWLWTRVGTANVVHQGRPMQARHKAWLLSGRTLGRTDVLYTDCGVEQCIRPPHQRIVHAPGMRTGRETRGVRVARRNAQMVALVTQYGWTRQRVAELFECSPALVNYAVRALEE